MADHVAPPPYAVESLVGYGTDGRILPQVMENRPRLPERCRNHHLATLPEDTAIVKFQTIVREGKEIVVGRIKVPTPGVSPHAFILRRYDTQAVSLTTMYKVAFPEANEEDEKREMDWVKSSFDTRNTNGGRDSDHVKLAGQWVSRNLAMHLAPAYGLQRLVAALSRAEPDPNVAYRKSQRSQAAADSLAQGRTPASAATPASTAVEAPAPKRQRNSSPPATARQGSHAVQIEATTSLTTPTGTQLDMEAEILAAKQLVLDLRRELEVRVANGEQVEAGSSSTAVTTDGRGRKRGVVEVEEDDDFSNPLKIAGADRAIVRNRRVEAEGMGAKIKRAALGAAIFGLGVGATSVFPRLASMFL